MGDEENDFVWAVTRPRVLTLECVSEFWRAPPQKVLIQEIWDVL